VPKCVIEVPGIAASQLDPRNQEALRFAHSYDQAVLSDVAPVNAPPKGSDTLTLFGKGFGNGTQSHLDYLPEGHTDFVFATMAEEWGIVGGFFILFLYFMLMRWGLRVRWPSRSRPIGLFTVEREGLVPRPDCIASRINGETEM
jgi:hypothetical protein